ncbi:hypothetical protein V6N12_023192 [Hibiscus sabdariffa]|uniref:Uncharacterized protein n=1 Tax=Hibiscus sabdariffa TaxID=183260 RepID=A0ABR2FXS4_9ROSI
MTREVGSSATKMFDELSMPVKKGSNSFDNSTKAFWEDDFIKGSSETQHIDERLRTTVEVEDFQTKSIIVIDEVYERANDIVCDMNICHQFSVVDEGH